MELTQKANQLTLTYHQQKMQAKYHNETMLIEASTAMHSSLTWQAMTGVIRPTDFTAVNASRNQGSQMEVQAAVTLSQIQMIENEWKNFGNR